MCVNKNWRLKGYSSFVVWNDHSVPLLGNLSKSSNSLYCPFNKVKLNDRSKQSKVLLTAFDQSSSEQWATKIYN